MRRVLVVTVFISTLLVIAPVWVSSLRDHPAREVITSSTQAAPTRPVPTTTTASEQDRVADSGPEVQREQPAGWQRIDPLSLETLSEPLELGIATHTAVSRNQRYLASVRYLTSADSKIDWGSGRMMLADTAAWKVIAHAPVDGMISNRCCLRDQHRREPVPGMPRSARRPGPARRRSAGRCDAA